MWTKIWNWIDGYKSIICAVILQIVNSDYIASLITNASLYTLIQSVAAILFAGAVFHHVKKERDGKA